MYLIYVSVGAQESRGIRFPGAGLSGSCALLIMGAENWVQVLFRSRTGSSSHSHLSSLEHFPFDFFLDLFLFYLCVCVSIYVHMCACAPKGQKKVSAPLALAKQPHCIGIWIWTPVLMTEQQELNCWAVSLVHRSEMNSNILLKTQNYFSLLLSFLFLFVFGTRYHGIQAGLDPLSSQDHAEILMYLSPSTVCRDYGQAALWMVYWELRIEPSA